MNLGSGFFAGLADVFFLFFFLFFTFCHVADMFTIDGDNVSLWPGKFQSIRQTILSRISLSTNYENYNEIIYEFYYISNNLFISTIAETGKKNPLKWPLHRIKLYLRLPGVRDVRLVSSRFIIDICCCS